MFQRCSVRRAGVAALVAALTTATFGLAIERVSADGTETLGPPSIPIAAGTSFVLGGTGTRTQPASIILNVPAGATVVQVLAYWEGQHSAPAVGNDNTVVLNGTAVTGQLIGGPTFLGNVSPEGDFYTSTYRADVTGLGLVKAGANTVTVSGMAFNRRTDGLGLAVVIDEGGAKSELIVRDGSDFAFINSGAAALKATVPQTITFTAAAVDRTAPLGLFASSVQELPTRRPTNIRVTVGGTTTEYPNLFRSIDGNEWDTLRLPVTIPAGATSLTVQVFSEDPANPDTGDLPASLVWNGFALSLPAPPAAPPPPTTTTTTTTTAPPPSSSDVPTTPAPPTSQVPSSAIASVLPPPPAAPPSTLTPTLPETGGATLPTMLIALALIGLGALLLVARRRPRHS
jgi:LPXTG-motif cell wall-anchored protein